MQKTGVVGLGNMGAGMALSLQRKGHAVCGYDAAPAARAALAEAGLPIAASLAQLAGAVDVLILSLPTSAIVEEVVFGPGGVLASARAGLIVVDTTTADPNSTRKVAQALAASGVHFIDAPVSGGPQGAASASMGMLLGGDAALLNAVEPVLAAISAKRVRVGPVGAGHTAKLLNNLLAGAHLLIAGEAARIAAAADLDPEAIFEGLNAGSAASKVTQHNFPNWIFNDAFNSGFTMKLMRKDFRLAMALINETGAAAPLAREAGRLWAGSADTVADGEDFNRIVGFVEK